MIEVRSDREAVEATALLGPTYRAQLKGPSQVARIFWFVLLGYSKNAGHVKLDIMRT